MEGYTFINKKIYDILPNGKVNVYYDEQISTETVERKDPDTDETLIDSYNVYTYQVAVAESYTYTDIIVALIRAKYTENDELALQRQKDEKPSEYNEYYAYVEWCKAYSKYIIEGETIDTVKAIKIAELLQYDASNEVNSFLINNVSLWISPASRANYLLTIEAAKESGIDYVIFEKINLPVSTALDALKAINLYAMQCVTITNMHKNTINLLNDIETIKNYNFKNGYPEKLIF